MRNKHCQWCDHSFEASVSYQIYCSVECREQATKEKIAERYMQTRVYRRVGKKRSCKSCGSALSIFNDEAICSTCSVNPADVKKAIKEIKDLANEADNTDK